MRTWILARAASWRILVAAVAKLRAGGAGSIDEALNAVESYRGLARDLAMARRVAPQSRTTAALESLYSQLHALISRKPVGSRHALAGLLRTSIPQAASAIRGKILLMASLMISGALVGWWLISTFPALISLIASPTMIDHVEKGHLWTEGIINVTPSSILSISILANNIMVSVLAFCAGIFLGLATFYLVLFNGLMLGAVFAFVSQHHLAAALFAFTIAHGPVELSVICIAGACGVALGESIIRPQLPTRRDSFEACAHQLAPLIMLCAALLIGCGFIEGLVSPDPLFPLASRVVIGVCYFVVMIVLLSGRLLGATVKRGAVD
ncbi:MAG TPA: stage II sporulation protein M [Steroidobacteraceae bacterium]